MARPRPLPCALHARALLATRRSSTSAIETNRKHDLRTDETLIVRSHFELSPAARSTKRFAAPFGAAKPSGHGSGAEMTFALASVLSSPRRDCARRELRPNPICSDTPCRGLEISPAREADPIVRAHPATLPTCAGRIAPETRFRFASRRAASRTLPRRRMRSAAPEVPSVIEPPLREGLLSTRCPQPVE